MLQKHVRILSTRQRPWLCVCKATYCTRCLSAATGRADASAGTVCLVCTYSSAIMYSAMRSLLTTPCCSCYAQSRAMRSTQMLARSGEHSRTSTCASLTRQGPSSSSCKTTRLSSLNSPSLHQSYSQILISASTSIFHAQASPNPSP